MNSKKVIGLFVSLSLFVILVGWLLLFPSFFSNDSFIHREVVFESSSCSYGYVYLDRDIRSPEASDSAFFNGYDSRVIPVSIDPNNPLVFDVVFKIPEDNPSDYYFKVVFYDVYNNKEYVRVLSFSV